MRHALVVALVLMRSLAGQSPSPPQDDVHLIGGVLADGSGGPIRKADLAISQGRIVAIGSLAGRVSARTITVEGLVVAPGFVDVHAHADSEALLHGDAANFLQMGVTTLITGNCGGSVLDLKKHFTDLETRGIGVNYGSLIGHGSVRERCMGTEKRAPNEAELSAMKALIAQGMEHGAFGISTGLIYVPGTYAETDELIEVSKVVAKAGGLYASHMRYEDESIAKAIDEALRICQQAAIPVHLSHLKLSGKPAFGRATEILKKIGAARDLGLPVTADQYAYTASSTGLDILFPTEALQIGRSRFAKRLKDNADFREEMERALLKTMDRNGFHDLGFAQIAYAPNNNALSGKTLREVAELRLKTTSREAQAKVTVDLFIEAQGARIGMVYHKMSEPDVETIMASPFVAVASDSGIRSDSDGKPHPRGTGNNVRVLGRYVREKKILELGLAIRKMSSLPAEIFKIEDRGTIRIGAFADVVAFDAETVIDTATYEAPLSPPIGMHYVFVNGEMAVDQGRIVPKRFGQILRRTPSAK